MHVSGEQDRMGNMLDPRTPRGGEGGGGGDVLMSTPAAGVLAAVGSPRKSGRPRNCTVALVPSRNRANILVALQSQVKRSHVCCLHFENEMSRNSR